VNDNLTLYASWTATEITWDLEANLGIVEYDSAVNFNLGGAVVSTGGEIEYGSTTLLSGLELDSETGVVSGTMRENVTIYAYIFTIKATSKLTLAEKDLSFEVVVVKAKLASPSLDIDTFVYDGTLKTVEFREENPLFEWLVNSDHTQSAVNAGTYIAQVRLAISQNYTWEDPEVRLFLKLNWTITKAPQVYKGPVTTWQITTDRIGVDFGPSQTAGFLYSISGRDTWSTTTLTDVVFNNLIPNTSYTISVKLAGDNNHEESNVLTISVTTKNGFTVTSDSEGGSEVASVIVVENGKLAEPTSPTRAAYTFEGWYKSLETWEVWDFEVDVVTSNVTLYAHWSVTPLQWEINTDL
jgi:uncharacterized repeat protein (TIGR02543 family)